MTLGVDGMGCVSHVVHLLCPRRFAAGGTAAAAVAAAAAPSGAGARPAAATALRDVGAMSDVAGNHKTRNNPSCLLKTRAVTTTRAPLRPFPAHGTAAAAGAAAAAPTGGGPSTARSAARPAAAARPAVALSPAASCC
eukprot:gene15713-biopygen17201